jgi:hypothetical protein
MRSHLEQYQTNKTPLDCNQTHRRGPAAQAHRHPPTQTKSEGGSGGVTPRKKKGLSSLDGLGTEQAELCDGIVEDDEGAAKQARGEGPVVGGDGVADAGELLGSGGPLAGAIENVLELGAVGVLRKDELVLWGED